MISKHAEEQSGMHKLMFHCKEMSLKCFMVNTQGKNVIAHQKMQQFHSEDYTYPVSRNNPEVESASSKEHPQGYENSFHMFKMLPEKILRYQALLHRICP